MIKLKIIKESKQLNEVSRDEAINTLNSKSFSRSLSGLEKHSQIFQTPIDQLIEQLKTSIVNSVSSDIENDSDKGLAVIWLKNKVIDAIRMIETGDQQGVQTIKMLLDSTQVWCYS